MILSRLFVLPSSLLSPRPITRPRHIRPQIRGAVSWPSRTITINGPLPGLAASSPLVLFILSCCSLIHDHCVFANHAPPNFQMESNSADPARRRPRIPGGFNVYDSSDGEDGEHNSETYSTSTFLFEGPGIRISRTSGNPMATISSTTRPGGTQGGGTGQPGVIAEPNMVEMLQTIFASIMGDQGIERVRQQAHGEPGAGAGEDAPGAAGGDHAPQDPRTRGNAPPMPPGLEGLFGPPTAGSRFVYERHTIPPRGALPVDDLPSCVTLFL